jgi:hypothetical protein
MLMPSASDRQVVMPNREFGGEGGVPVGDDRRDRTYRRVGDTAKCPACGWRMDPDAYRCPKCYIYFCFKCRTRVAEREPQFHCADQACPQYGKLLCAACTVMVPEFKDVTRVVSPHRSEQVGDYWGCAALFVPIPVGVWLSVQFSPAIGAAGAVGVFILMAVILTRAGSTWFPTTRWIPAVRSTSNEQVAEHRSCIQCRHPVKVLR